MQNVWCWLFGHEVIGESGAGTYRTAEGEICPAWGYICARCKEEGFPVHRMTLYHRTIRWRLHKYKNKLSFAYMHWRHSLES